LIIHFSFSPFQLKNALSVAAVTDQNQLFQWAVEKAMCDLKKYYIIIFGIFKFDNSEHLLMICKDAV